jgi:formylglycine-generating enzyme required for sulfatase activity
MMKTKIITAAILAALYGSASAVVTIDWVTVGNAGNAADPLTGSLYGAVAYDYKIAKNETTIAQYAEFLNAVAKTDSYGLYSASMTTSYINGISQSGSSGSFIYSVNPGSANKPITFVSWFDAARFCNWLQNGQQTGGGAALTAETGAYSLNGATSGLITKNVGATVWIPNENEWYKAAYYDPSKDGGVGGYWLYPNQSNALTSNTIGVAGAANFNDGDYVGYPGMALTDVGAYGANSDSYYGTNDQAGNVWEWFDPAIDTDRGNRGGSYLTQDYFSESGWRDTAFISSGVYQGATTGFRLASAIPEPTTGLLAVLGLFPLLSRRRKA